MLADANILWLGAVLVLVLATLATGRGGWLPRAVVLVSAAGAVAFAAANPDGRIASRNVDRYLAGGRHRRRLPRRAQRRRRGAARAAAVSGVRRVGDPRGPRRRRRPARRQPRPLARPRRARRSPAAGPLLPRLLGSARCARSTRTSGPTRPPDPEPWAWERRRALLLGEARPGERVLDLGCGAGRFVAALRDAGADAVGVEIAAAALERARAVAPGADLRLLGARRLDPAWSTGPSTSCGAPRCSSTSPTARTCSRRRGGCCGRAGGSS